MRQDSFPGLLAGLFVMIAALVLGGCSGADPDPITSIPQTSAFAPAKDEYRLQQGDRVKVVVLGQEAMSGDYSIDGSGAIDVSNVGLVPVAGMTAKEAEAQLTQKIGGRGIVEAPQVSVLLSSVAGPPQ